MRFVLQITYTTLVLLSLACSGFGQVNNNQNHAVISPKTPQKNVSSGTMGRTTMEMMNTYFSFLAQGNFEIAADMWTPKALERSSRFGIRFKDIALKVDCVSPVINNYDIMKHYLDLPVNAYESIDEEGYWFRLHFSRLIKSDKIEYDYFAQVHGDWSWLSHPQDFYSADWAIHETKYLRIHVHPHIEQYLNPAVINAADDFIKNMINILNISKIDKKLIEDKKIEYFYCNTEETVEQITGHKTRGMLDMAFNDIISASFPHFHEMVHLLVNIRLKELPLYSLPILREGIAVKYGGRWGKSNASLTQLGAFLYREKLIELDSILTMNGFMNQAGADIIYPVAGIFYDYIIKEVGIEKSLELYLNLSGKYSELIILTEQDIKQTITSSLGYSDWDSVIKNFDDYLDNHIVKDATVMPGITGKGKELINNEMAIVRKNGDWIEFEFKPDPEDKMAQGNLLFAKDKDLEGHPSFMFEEQYLQKEINNGYRFGVRFDKNEAGLYDYAGNQLLAKYIWGITPSDDYYDADNHRITLRFHKSLFDGNLPDKKDYFLLSN